MWDLLIRMPESFLEAAGFLGFVFIGVFIYTHRMWDFLNRTCTQIRPASTDTAPSYIDGMRKGVGGFVYGLCAIFSFVVLEELLRLCVLAGIIGLFPGSTAVVWLSIIGWAVVFGLLHKDAYVHTTQPVIYALALQGLTSGLVLNLLYMKFGGAYGNPMTGISVCIGFHFVWNLMCYSISHITKSRQTRVESSTCG